MFNVPALFVDIQHVTFSYIPSVLGAAVNFFKIQSQNDLDSDEAKIISGVAAETGNTADAHSSKYDSTCEFIGFYCFFKDQSPFFYVVRLVTTERLVMAKRLLYNEYSNVLIDVFIAAPTIIIPTNSQQQSFQFSPVLVAHLGSLAVSQR